MIINFLIIIDEKMNYYIREVQTNEGVQKTAGIKARDDVESILSANGYHAITVRN